ncbi:MAG: hypothetical protein GX649_08210 [Chloroflexi bacterium]|nr:hypothetical protein [Chloroflexota bacterium]
MAVITSIHATYGRRWNLDDYESATVNLEAFADVEEGETPEEAAAKVFEYLKEQVATQSIPVLVKRDERRRLRVEEVLEGLPVRLRELAVSFIQSFKNDVPRDQVIDGGSQVRADLAEGRVHKQEA